MLVIPVVPMAALAGRVVVDGDDETAGVVRIVVVVVEVGTVADVTTTPEGGRETSPMGTESVGPLG